MIWPTAQKRQLAGGQLQVAALRTNTKYQRSNQQSHK